MLILRLYRYAKIGVSVEIRFVKDLRLEEKLQSAGFMDLNFMGYAMKTDRFYQVLLLRNIDDRKVLDTLFEGMEGLFVGDAGYLLKKMFGRNFLKTIHLFTGVRNNMKKLMTKEQHEELKKREIIETVWTFLKVIYQ